MNNPVKNMSKRKKITVLTVAVIIIVLTLMGIINNRSEPLSLPASNAFTVEVAKAGLTDMQRISSFKANLLPQEEAIVSSQISGQVTDVLFENGDHVAQGQALVVLDSADLENRLITAQIGLQNMLNNLDYAQSDYDKAKTLYDAGAISKSSLENAEKALNGAKTSVQLQQASIDAIKISLANSVLNAPIAGEITEKSISVGQFITPGMVFAKVKNNSAIKASIQLKESDLGKVTVGQKVKLKLSQSDTVSYEGKITNIAASADRESRTFDCQILVDNKDGSLHSGIYGYVEIAGTQKEKVLTVPLAALLGSENAYYVFTFENGIAQKTAVTIGEIQNDTVEVAKGLKEGQEVIITNLNSLQNGDKVAVSAAGKEGN